MTITKKKLADNLADHIGLTYRESKALVESFFNQIRNTLAAGEEVKLSGFGKFTIREKNPRPGRNPRTAEMIPIAARRVVTFRASPLLKEACLAAMEEQG
ncbi:integration host factor subunit alpha [Acidithiobacillus ferrooxidans]|jgi:integration host factor subunit alpha|uniref:integration host factor subunit alpha n=1 Tax=Acidithiobacillus ferrooxidans TaxID=920 RepID=UPI00214CEA11|nr:integration host factor subunit alpha [Acidithiobacillus ferrooxidans]MCR2831927.1 integration host factor subunit alpha [Acidithiobacillus ferrooxidans]